VTRPTLAYRLAELRDQYATMASRVVEVEAKLAAERALADALAEALRDNAGTHGQFSSMPEAAEVLARYSAARGD
jgi:hypothetical protein